jgi:hypothetical protein
MTSRAPRAIKGVDGPAKGFDGSDLHLGLASVAVAR